MPPAASPSAGGGNVLTRHYGGLPGYVWVSFVASAAGFVILMRTRKAGTKKQAAMSSTFGATGAGPVPGAGPVLQPIIIGQGPPAQSTTPNVGPAANPNNPPWSISSPAAGQSWASFIRQVSQSNPLPNNITPVAPVGNRVMPMTVMSAVPGNIS